MTQSIAANRTRVGVAKPNPLNQTVRLYLNELRLFSRETNVLIFVFGFPVVTMLVLSGVFGTDTGQEGFEFTSPTDYYSVAYFGIVLCSIGLIMLPAHIAGYRERGVLRRFNTSGMPFWSFAVAQFLSGATFAVLGFGSLIITATLANGLPSVDDPARMVVGLVVSTLAFISIGVALGMLLPNAKAAQGLGLTLFFPMFLLAGGGPPLESLTGTMRSMADWLPLTHAIRSIQEPWLDLGDGQPHLLIVSGIAVVSTIVWLWRSVSVLGSD